MQESIWWINGDLIPTTEATLPITDHGFTVGDGCFEVTPIVRGEPFAMRRHLARLHHSLRGLGISLALPDDAIRQAAQQVVDANPSAGILRLTVTAGPGPLGSGRGDGPATIVIGASPKPNWPASDAVVTVPWRRNERGVLTGLKTTSYADNAVALAHAREMKATEALFANTAGQLCEGTGSNVFVEHDGRLVTPPLSSGCLAGITRALVMELCEVEEVDLPMEVLTTTSEAFLTSSSRDVQAIDRIDGRAMPVGPLTRAAAAALDELMANDIDP